MSMADTGQWWARIVRGRTVPRMVEKSMRGRSRSFWSSSGESSELLYERSMMASGAATACTRVGCLPLDETVREVRERALAPAERAETEDGMDTCCGRNPPT